MQTLFVRTTPRAAFKQTQLLPEWTPELARKAGARRTQAFPPDESPHAPVPAAEIPLKRNPSGFHVNAGATQP